MDKQEHAQFHKRQKRTSTPIQKEANVAGKRGFQLVIFLMVLMLALPLAFAQSGQENAKRSEAMKIVDFAVRDVQGEEVGDVENIIVTPDGKIYAVLEIGGFLGLGQDKVIVPYDQLQQRGIDYVVFAGTQEELENLPEYEEGESRQYIRRTYRVVSVDEEAQQQQSRQKEEQARKEAQQQRQEKDGTREQQREYREGDRMVSALTFPAPGGDGQIVLEREGLQQVRANESYEYTLRITNETQYPVHEVVIKEYLTDNIEVESVDLIVVDEKKDLKTYGDKSDRKQEEKTYRNEWKLGTLAAGESRTIQVQAVAKDQGEARSCIIVDFEPSLCNTFNIVKPELELTRKIVNTEGETIDIAYVCDDVNMVYTLENTGTGKTGKATIKEELPEGISPQEGKGNVSIPVESLGSGQKVEKQVMIKAGEPTEFSGRASATTGKLTVHSDRSGVRLVKPELALSMDGPMKEYLGRSLTYKIRLENTSDIPAFKTVVKLSLPQPIKNMTTSTQKVEMEGDQFDIGRLDGGESREFSVTYDATDIGKLTIEAAANAYCAMARVAKVTTNVLGIPAILIETIDRVDPVKVGQETVYEIRVKNQGSAEDLNIKLVGKLPPELTFVSGEGDTKVSAKGQNVDFATIKSLPPGEVFSWNVTAKGAKVGKSKFRLELKSDANVEPVIVMEPTTVY